MLQFKSEFAKFPLVIKYEGMAESRGSFICDTFGDAKSVIQKCFENLYKAVVIEEFITGKEVVFQVITDGYTAIPLSPVQNYQKLYDGNTGPNTDGMGAYAPVTAIDRNIEQKIAEKIIFPLLDGMSNEGCPFTGVLSVGLIIDKHNNPIVIEFDAGFGDTEAQTTIPLIQEDFFELLYSTASGSLSDDYQTVKLSDDSVATVVLTSVGYPKTVKKGNVIEGLENIDDDDILIFHAGTCINQNGELVVNGGRVLSVVAQSSTLRRAYERVYEAVSSISFKDMRYRKDIAKAQVNNNLNLL